MESITRAQRKVICMIEENLDIEFKGFSKLEATIFISTCMEQSKKAAAQYSLKMKEHREMWLYDLRDEQEVDWEEHDHHYGLSWFDFH